MGGEQNSSKSKRKKWWREKRSSHSCGNKLFENKGEAVLAVQLHFLAVCVSENSKPRLLLKERGGGKREKKRQGSGGVLDQYQLFSEHGVEPWPRAEKEEGGRGREGEWRVRGVALYSWLYFLDRATQSILFKLCTED